MFLDYPLYSVESLNEGPPLGTVRNPAEVMTRVEYARWVNTNLNTARKNGNLIFKGREQSYTMESQTDLCDWKD
jgi:hypothetical protein